MRNLQSLLSSNTEFICVVDKSEHANNKPEQLMTTSLQQYWTFFIKYLAPLRKKAALLAVLILAMIGLQLVNPQIIRYFIDTATATGVAGAKTQSLVWAALTFLGAALL